ncbi:MAG: hypothetical protein ABIF88_01765 [archaeon]
MAKKVNKIKSKHFRTCLREALECKTEQDILDLDTNQLNELHNLGMPRTARKLYLLAQDIVGQPVQHYSISLVKFSPSETGFYDLNAHRGDN